jgi:hypothetical protein
MRRKSAAAAGVNISHVAHPIHLSLLCHPSSGHPALQHHLPPQYYTQDALLPLSTLPPPPPTTLTPRIKSYLPTLVSPT